jgi:hypothetical protein
LQRQLYEELATTAAGAAQALVQALSSSGGAQEACQTLTNLCYGLGAQAAHAAVDAGALPPLVRLLGNRIEPLACHAAETLSAICCTDLSLAK